jgi:predicted anti-sigma-YlaC factor YlaD
MASLACQQVVELVTDYLEGSLRRRTRRRIEEHLAGCPGCQRYLDQMRETLAVLGTVPADSLSPEAQQTLLDAFRDIRR